MQIPTSSPGLRGIQSAQLGMQQTSQRIVAAATSEANPLGRAQLTHHLAELKRDSILFDASAKVVKTTEGNVGRLVDLLA